MLLPTFLYCTHPILYHVNRFLSARTNSSARRAFSFMFFYVTQSLLRVSYNQATVALREEDGKRTQLGLLSVTSAFVDTQNPKKDCAFARGATTCDELDLCVDRRWHVLRISTSPALYLRALDVRACNPFFLLSRFPFPHRVTYQSSVSKANENAACGYFLSIKIDILAADFTRTCEENFAYRNSGAIPVYATDNQIRRTGFLSTATPKLTGGVFQLPFYRGRHADMCGSVAR